MANLVVTFLPSLIINDDNMLEVFGQVTVDGGNYATGGVQGVWDYSTAVSTTLALSSFKEVPSVIATRTPHLSQIICGDPSHAFYAVPVSGSPLPKLMVLNSADGTEATNGAALASSTQTPVYPHAFHFKYKKNL